MRTKKFILLLSIVFLLLFSTTVQADSEFATDKETVIIEDKAKNTTVIEDQKESLPETGLASDIFIAAIIGLGILGTAYAYGKIKK